MKSFKNILKEDVNLDYNFPDSKKQQMMDFYISTVFVPTGNEDLDGVVRYFKGILYPALKEELLNDVYLAICMESIYIFDYKIPLNKIKKFMPEYLQLFEDFSKHWQKQHDSYKAATHAIKKNRMDVNDFVMMCKKLFDDRVFRWPQNYGGDAWVAICDGWLKLYGSETSEDEIVWIDHIYDLQHNTGTIFSKLKSYAVKDGRTDWVNIYLDVKKKSKDPKDLLPYCSYDMKRLAMYYFKETENFSLESQDPKSKQSAEKNVWRTGDWEDGTWYGGTWVYGTWYSGVWKTGTWKDGTWYAGTWEGGTWKEGQWFSGTWEGGTWEGGTWEDGTWEGGTWKKGEWYDGMWKDGTWNGGTWEDGTWEGGTWKKGEWNYGVWKDGTWEGGTWEGGQWKIGWIYDPKKKGKFKPSWKWNKDFVRSPISPEEYFAK